MSVLWIRIRCNHPQCGVKNRFERKNISKKTKSDENVKNYIHIHK